MTFAPHIYSLVAASWQCGKVWIAQNALKRVFSSQMPSPIQVKFDRGSTIHNDSANAT